MTQMESPKRKMQKKNDYQRHKLFRKIKRRRKAQAEAEQHIAEKQLRRKLRLPKFDTGDDAKMVYLRDIVGHDHKYGIHQGVPNNGNWKIIDVSPQNLGYDSFGNLRTIDVMPDRLFNSGKDINIKKSKRGTFTKAAKAHGMSVQGFANKVLKNPSNYSVAMRKKANFARNAASWKH